MAILAGFVGMTGHASGVLHPGEQFVLGDERRPVVFLRPQRDEVRMAGFTVVGTGQVIMAGVTGGHCGEAFLGG